VPQNTDDRVRGAQSASILKLLVMNLNSESIALGEAHATFLEAPTRRARWRTSSPPTSGPATTTTRRLRPFHEIRRHPREAGTRPAARAAGTGHPVPKTWQSSAPFRFSPEQTDVLVRLADAYDAGNGRSRPDLRRGRVGARHRAPACASTARPSDPAAPRGPTP
jgi:hypothetical protein